ncbi:ABC transporter ATP-binding protein/permease [Christensenellaceae bacterium OttesenSCG-928-L17]|nr:ABC transporter ATP-binding protein/permease [Christensenellaceae bacterium OttesenSCG-928-L17]
MKTIRVYLKPYMGRIGAGLCIKFIGTLMDLVLPWLLAYLVDVLMVAGDTRAIYRCGALMALCSLIAVTFNIIANRMAAGNSADFTKALRHDLYRHIAYLPAQQRERYAVPSLVSRLTSDTYNVHHLVDKIQRLGVRAPLLLLGGMLFAFALEPALALVMLMLVPLLALVVWRTSKKGVPLFAKVQQRTDQLVRTIRENAMGVRVIKALFKTEYEKERFFEANAATRDAEKEANSVMAITNPAMSFLLNMGFMLVILVGAYRVNNGVMQPGKIMGFLSYFTIILNAVLSVTKIFVLWSKGSASAARIAEVLNTPADVPLCARDHVESDACLSFENVSFSYNKVRNNLENVSFSLLKGQTLGIIGPTGSGKTTLVNLLLRFYDADTGVIRLHGDRLEGIPLPELRKHFGVVLQNDVLLNESVYENISFLRGIPREEVARAARAAQIAPHIETMEHGYDSVLDIRGANLSGGQKQRILIARALAGNPPILVLDDAESALDYRTNAALRRALREEYGGTTTIVVSQRVSAIKNADVILLLDNGRVEGMGTHETLMHSCEAYRNIATVQMGGGV